MLDVVLTHDTEVLRFQHLGVTSVRDILKEQGKKVQKEKISGAIGNIYTMEGVQL